MNNLEKALFVSPAAQPPSQLQRRAQGVVDSGLPAVAAGEPPREDDCILPAQNS